MSHCGYLTIIASNPIRVYSNYSLVKYSSSRAAASVGFDAIASRHRVWPRVSVGLDTYAVSTAGGGHVINIRYPIGFGFLIVISERFASVSWISDLFINREKLENYDSNIYPVDSSRRCETQSVDL